MRWCRTQRTNSLLKSRRQELHAKIARVIEQHFPNIKTTEPEVLAHHLTEAGLAEAAIPLWQAAGELAFKRMAMAEAIAHLNQGLELVATLPRSSQRDASELGLRTLLGTAWMALMGWQLQEVWDSLHPALALANSLRRNDALLSILWGLFIHVLNKGRLAESLGWVEQIHDAAEAYHDPDLLIIGHHAAAISDLWLGELIKAREHAEQILALYSEERHGSLVNILNQDSKTIALICSAHLTWMLGYPDQALKISDAKDAYARQRGHPFDLGWALTTGAQLFDHLREPDEELKRVEEAERLGHENSMPVLLEILVPSHYGIALIRKGKVADGMASLKAGLGNYEKGGGKANTPYCKSVLADGMAHLGDLDGALRLMDEIIEQIERPGWGERHYYAEILRLKGWMLSLKGDLEGAERNYLASLDWARHQQAKSWELRTSTSYARLMRRQGRAREACELLAPVYGWFTEGFATKDLKEAKELLEELKV